MWRIFISRILCIKGRGIKKLLSSPDYIFGGNEMKVVVIKPGKMLSGILRLFFGIKKNHSCD